MAIRNDLSSVKANVFRRIDEAFPQQCSFLQQLIRIETVNPPGKYEEIMRFLSSFAAENGLRSEIFETPQQKCIDAGLDANEHRLSIKITEGNLRPRILLLAHADTVPIGDKALWKHDPFKGEIAEGKIYGRGACDCKGRIAGYVFALLALKRELKSLPSEVSVAVTADEEIGGTTGAKYLLDEKVLDCDLCIGEGYTWEVFHGFKGLLWFRITIKGATAHGSTPNLGISVVPALEDILRQLREYREQKLSSSVGLSDTTMNVGIVHAGSKINMVPDFATVEIDFRVGSNHKVKQIIAEVSEIVERVKHANPSVSITLDVPNESEPISLDPHHNLVKTVHSAVEEVANRKIPVTLWFAHSDTLHFLKKGIPCVNYGAGRAGVAHITDEYVDLEDLRLSTKAVALSILKLMTGTGADDA
ncbi:MAG TPA: ArgE/DapE family deacylase [Candidatus Bathyarchaeia archaeon]|nr:ArgE/DapE family deacylase [Candidatus Bathyarchaeia archaeon]